MNTIGLIINFVKTGMLQIYYIYHVYSDKSNSFSLAEV